MYISDLGIYHIFFLYYPIPAPVLTYHSNGLLWTFKSGHLKYNNIKICLDLTSKCNSSHGQAVLSSLIENHLSNYN